LQNTDDDIDWLCDDNQPQEPSRIAVDKPRWVVLVVDDDKEVHNSTDMAVKGFSFEGKSLEILHAYSGEETNRILESRDDIAVILLDVVMESEHAGLNVVKYVRFNLANRITRIILRTGQPGVAPEQRVIRDYDIDGYYNKTHMRQQNLEAALYISLRAYRDIRYIEAQKATLERIIAAISNISVIEDLASFSNAILDQIKLTLSVESLSMFIVSLAPSQVDFDKIRARVLTVDDGGVSFFDQSDLQMLNPSEQLIYQSALERKESFSMAGYLVEFVSSDRGHDCVFALESEHDFNDEQARLIRVFMVNVILAYEKVLLEQSVKHTQSIILSLLGSATESRSKETGAHVIRVGLYSKLLASLYGCSKNFAQSIQLASQLHDVGKVATPDHILNKQGKLTADEWFIMQQHALKGWEILQGTGNDVIDMGAEIALDHHEHWNGKGYPNQKSKDEISLGGRIVAIADVFDALCSKRCYKSAWGINDAKALVIKNSAQQFDPYLVEIFVQNFSLFEAIWNNNPDQSNDYEV
jgi:response regulator RpfG family c-di-GMP phosphodiesterase